MHIDRPIIIALTLVIILLLVFFLVVPEYNNFKASQVVLGEKVAEFSAKYDYYATISKAMAELQSRKDDIKKIDDALPQNSDLGKIIYFLQETAKDKGLVVKDSFLSKSSVNNSKANAGNVIKDISFSLDLSGNYLALGNFISALESSSRIFEITSISFSAPANSVSQNFNMQIITHSY